MQTKSIETLQEIAINDTVKFKVNLAGRMHFSQSKVYGFSERGNLLISCNGFRKTFELRHSEVYKIIKAPQPKRKYHYENEACRNAGLITTCNSCDRILYEGETYHEGGYCSECNDTLI